MHNQIYTVIGKSGSGKSHLVAGMIDYYYRNEIRENIIVIDSSNDYKEDKGLDFLNHLYLQEDEVGEIDIEAVIKDHKQVLFEFAGMTEEKRRSLCDQIVNAVFNLGNTLLVVDEGYLFVPKQGKMKSFQKALSGGRKEGIDQIYIIQRVQQINLLVLSQKDVLISFNINESKEIEKVRENIPVDVKPETFQNLKEREFLTFYKDQVDKRKNELNI